MLWYELCDDIAVSLIPKNGTHTLSQVTKPLSKDIVLYPQRVAFFREPIERLQSAFFFFRWLQYQRVHYENDAVFENLASYEDFVDYALEFDDAHWKPQVELIEDWTEILSVKQISQFIYDKIGLVPPSDNSVLKFDINSDYRKTELMRYYAGDYKWL